MPLPAALQARLMKRGIITQETSGSSSTQSSSFNVFNTASPSGSLLAKNVAVFSGSAPSSDTELKSWIGCPNKCNPFHVCADYCRLKWAGGYSEPEKFTEKKRQLMLLKYPKPPGWKEIFDPGTGRHYYWNIVTDEVSWFPPEHPKANVTVSANKLRAILLKTNFRPTPEVSRYLYKSSPGVTTLISEFSNDPTATEETLKAASDEFVEALSGRDRAGGKIRYKPNREKEPLDPMDPAAYSDVPRGGWGVGLETGMDAKTGVDVTASGPLFQSRPYPSPGAILRRNAGIVDKKK